MKFPSLHISRKKIYALLLATFVLFISAAIFAHFWFDIVHVSILNASGTKMNNVKIVFSSGGKNPIALGDIDYTKHKNTWLIPPGDTSLILSFSDEKGISHSIDCDVYLTNLSGHELWIDVDSSFKTKTMTRR
jgi:hypothetical protein